MTSASTGGVLSYGITIAVPGNGDRAGDTRAGGGHIACFAQGTPTATQRRAAFCARQGRRATCRRAERAKRSKHSTPSWVLRGREAGAVAVTGVATAQLCSPLRGLGRHNEKARAPSRQPSAAPARHSPRVIASARAQLGKKRSAAEGLRSTLWVRGGAAVPAPAQRVHSGPVALTAATAGQGAAVFYRVLAGPRREGRARGGLLAPVGVTRARRRQRGLRRSATCQAPSPLSLPYDIPQHPADSVGRQGQQAGTDAGATCD